MEKRLISVSPGLWTISIKTTMLRIILVFASLGKRIIDIIFIFYLISSLLILGFLTAPGVLLYLILRTVRVVHSALQEKVWLFQDQVRHFVIAANILRNKEDPGVNQE